MRRSTLSRSLIPRDSRMSPASLSEISPRSNIQWMVPESAMPLSTLSGPPASTLLMCAAWVSARPPPLINFMPVSAQREP